MDEDNSQSNKRTDVGYKRPPAEHRFQKGHRPKPRKPKAVPQQGSNVALLRSILAEECRVVMGGKARRVTHGELILRRAIELASKKNAAMRRLVLELLVMAEDHVDQEPPTRMFINGVEQPWS